MKKTVILLVSLLSFGACIAQTINFELTTPAPVLQDADVGDMAFGDIDNDGDNDLMIIGKGGPILSTLYRNDGIGNFSEIMQTTIIDVFDGTVGFEDVDNDNDLDLLIIGSTSSPTRTANLYLNDGMGNFSVSVSTPFEPSSSGDFAFGDVDNDGDSDVIITGFDANADKFSTLYLNNGSGTFSEVTGTPFVAIAGSSVRFIDIENDNDLDVLMAGTDANGNALTTLYTNDSLGNFSLIPNTPFENCAGGDLAIGDSDNDGDMDILMCGDKGGNTIITQLYLNDGMGGFTLLPSTPFPGVKIGEISFSDLDKDGDVDVFLLGTGPGGLADNSIIANIYENQGGNNFVFADSLIGGYLSSHSIGDIDGDNDVDLVIGGTTTGLPVRATRMYTNLTPNATSIFDTKQVDNVELFPNPSNGLINIRTKEAKEFSVHIYSLMGELIHADHISNGLTHQVQLDVPNGIYVLVLKNNQATLREKIMIAK